jgi:hypothetical protein
MENMQAEAGQRRAEDDFPLPPTSSDDEENEEITEEGLSQLLIK